MRQILEELKKDHDEIVAKLLYEIHTLCLDKERLKDHIQQAIALIKDGRFVEALQLLEGKK